MTDNENDKNAANPAAALIKNAYKAGMTAMETMHRTGVDIPLTILEQMGVAEDKISSLKLKSGELIDELYTAIDSVAAKSGVVGGERSGSDDVPAKKSAPAKKKAGDKD